MEEDSFVNEAAPKLEVDRPGVEVVLRLDLDENDPRNRTPASKLPSLDDESQQAPEFPDQNA